MTAIDFSGLLQDEILQQLTNDPVETEDTHVPGPAGSNAICDEECRCRPLLLVLSIAAPLPQSTESGVSLGGNGHICQMPLPQVGGVRVVVLSRPQPYGTF